MVKKYGISFAILAEYPLVFPLRGDSFTLPIFRASSFVYIIIRVSLSAVLAWGKKIPVQQVSD